jgi:type III secretion protein U
MIPLASGAVFQAPASLAELSWSAISRLSLFALGVFVVFAPLDYALQRHQFMKGQRMSPDEIKREHKGQEGDPEVKGKRKQLAHELANEAPAKQSVRTADAVIVNPTHYAVAIRYRAHEAGVPIVVAKGIDDSALEIRRQAEHEGVPVFTQPPLARALHATPLMHPVPVEFFEPVAVILNWVDDIAAKRTSS